MTSSKSESTSFTAALVAATVVVVAFVAYVRSTGSIAPRPADVTPGESRHSVVAPLGESTNTSDAAKPAVIASVYECNDGTRRIFSDRACSSDAKVREVMAPNGMRPVLRARSLLPSRTGSGSPSPSVGKADLSDGSKQALCKGIDAEIDRINARMRDPYTASEGEWYRDRLRKLDDQRWDAKCRTH